MLFVDGSFLFNFLPLALILMRLSLGGNAGRFGNLPRLTLFCLTLVFYGFKQPWWLGPFFVSISFDFLWGHLLSKGHSDKLRLLWLLGSVAQNLCLLAIFKYRPAIHAILQWISPELAISFSKLDQTLPATPPPGISFYIFESLSYVIDVYRGNVKAVKNPLEFFAFIGMFPRFIAGPIMRYKEMVSQFGDYQGMKVGSGIFLFAIGFFLKSCFADNFALYVGMAFDKPMAPSLLEAWVGIVAFSLQLYFDFSGYSLMAMGLGQCLGFQFSLNFDRPYLSTSVQEFWRRWHISLGSWVRDYVFTPLALIAARRGKALYYAALLLTMVLIGAWHGPRWTYVAMGAWYGLFLCLEALTGFHRKLPSPVARVVTLLVVVVGWTLFRASDFPEAVRVLGAMGNFSNQPFHLDWAAFTRFPVSLACCGIGIFYCAFVERYVDYVGLTRLMPTWWPAQAGALMGLSLKLDATLTDIPFLYFQF